jgi:hypothetical protein
MIYLPLKRRTAVSTAISRHVEPPALPKSHSPQRYGLLHNISLWMLYEGKRETVPLCPLCFGKSSVHRSSDNIPMSPFSCSSRTSRAEIAGRSALLLRRRRFRRWTSGSCSTIAAYSTVQARTANCASRLWTLHGFHRVS